jgi:hypothetical protein
VLDRYHVDVFLGFEIFLQRIKPKIFCLDKESMVQGVIVALVLGVEEREFPTSEILKNMVEKVSNPASYLKPSCAPAKSGYFIGSLPEVPNSI